MVITRKTLMCRSLLRIGALLTALFLMLSACVPAVQDTAEEPLGKSENQESGAIESPADTPTPTRQVLLSTVRATELIPVTPSDPVTPGSQVTPTEPVTPGSQDPWGTGHTWRSKPAGDRRGASQPAGGHPCRPGPAQWGYPGGDLGDPRPSRHLERRIAGMPAARRFLHPGPSAGILGGLASGGESIRLPSL
jgi:hypothetical protein